MSAQTITLGCRLNFAESEAMRALAGEDAIIINSCAVTNEAVRQTRQAIRRAHRESPDKRIIVTGCAAQLDPESFAAMPEVSRVVGNAEKYKAEAFEPNRHPGPEPGSACHCRRRNKRRIPGQTRDDGSSPS